MLGLAYSSSILGIRGHFSWQVKNIVRENQTPLPESPPNFVIEKVSTEGETKEFRKKNRTKKGIELGKDERDNRAIDNCVTRKTILSSNINLSIFFVSLHSYCRKRFLPWHTQNSTSKSWDAESL